MNVNMDSALAMAGQGVKNEAKLGPAIVNALTYRPGNTNYGSDSVDKTPTDTPETPTTPKTPTTPSALADAGTSNTTPRGRNGVTLADGTFIGVNDVGPINSFNMTAANNAQREANAIIQRAVAARDGNGGGGTVASALRGLPLRNGPAEPEMINIPGQGLVQRNAMLTRMDSDYNQALIQSALGGQFGLENRALQNAGALAERGMMGDQAMAATELSETIQGQYRQLGGIQTAYAKAMAEKDVQGAAILKQMLDDLMVRMEGGTLASEEEPEAFANGGMVGGAGYGQTPQAPAVMQEVNAYRRYALGAKAAGLPVVSFEEFMGAGAPPQGQTNPSALAFANGGMVPDAGQVDGKMIIDPDPNAPTDSIPAVIDGQRPAKLDSGEFVLPADVVLFYGTDKLNKLIGAARKQEEASK